MTVKPWPAALLLALVTAAVPAAAFAQGDRFARDPRLDNQRDAYGVSSRQAAHMCAAAAEKALQGAAYKGVQVVGLKQVERKAEGYEIEAWISVSGGGPAGRGDGPLRGALECEIARGKIADMDFDGIPGV